MSASLWRSGARHLIPSIQWTRSLSTTATLRSGLEELVNIKDDEEYVPITGGAWSKELLENKSFDDLHKLWFVLLKEWNYLLGEEMRFEGASKEFPQPDRIDKVRLSMDRIKEVLSERGETDPDLERGRKLLMKVHAM